MIYLLYGLLAVTIILFVNKCLAQKRTKGGTCSTLIVLGSGGHTTEMISFLSTLDDRKYTPRHYIVAQSEKGKHDSRNKATQFETNKGNNNWNIHTIPRAREVGQSYITSIYTTLHALLYSMYIVAKLKPDLVCI
jgi:beta-1,4-N-acetylglucosaminyltransferase